MARKKKKREICFIPEKTLFTTNGAKKRVVLSLDQLETIRFIDYERLTQDECAMQMNVARTTVQSIYEEARSVIADALINGRELIIQGGEVEICIKSFEKCHTCNKTCYERIVRNIKEEEKMIVAIPFEDDKVFQHFGHTEEFKIFEIVDNKIVSEKLVNTNGKGHLELAHFLKDLDVNVLICGGIGQGAINALTKAKIMIYSGVCGVVDRVIKGLIDGKIVENGTANCFCHEEQGECHCGDDCCKEECCCEK